MRAAGVPVSQAIARGIILGFIRALAPQILSNPRFKCSESFVRRFLQTQLRWSYRSATQASQKTPPDWEAKCTDSFMRLAYQIKLHNIPSDLVINADQTGVVLLPVGKRTWNERGAKQVSVFAKDEKRQFTMMVASAASGRMLPFQAIWASKTAASLPKLPIRLPGESKGHRWFSGGDRHWSNLPAMQAVS